MTVNKAILERFDVEVSYSTFKFTDRDSGDVFQRPFSGILYNVLTSPFFPSSAELIWQLKTIPLMSVEEAIRRTFKYKGLDLATTTGDFFFAEKPNLQVKSNLTFSAKEQCLKGAFPLFEIKLINFLISFCTDQPESFATLTKHLVARNEGLYVEGKFTFDSESKRLTGVDEQNKPTLFKHQEVVEFGFELTDCSIQSADTVFVVVNPELESYILQQTEGQRVENEQFKDKLELLYKQSCISSNNDLPLDVSDLDCYDEETVSSLLSVPPTIQTHLAYA